MKRSLAALAVGALALGWIVFHAGAAEIGRDIRSAGWAVPLMACVHIGQLTLSAAAWRIALGGPGIGLGTMLRIRWIREGVNALLPVAQIGGQVMGVRMLVRGGMEVSMATAGTVLDVTLEAAAQFVFTLAGLVMLALLGAVPASRGWIVAGVLLTGLAAGAFLIVQRLGALRLMEAAVARIAARWPALASWSLQGVHDRLMGLQRDWRGMLRAVALHSVSWAVGGVEVWIALAALGHPVGWRQGLVIESLGMVARSAGFAVPGALGIQEGGFVLACAVFGIPQEAAIALSILKRLREIVVGVPALVVVALR